MSEDPRILPQAEREELLRKNWMTHDAMWFLHTLQECGIEKTSQVNRAAVRSMGEIEARRLQRALGIEAIRTFADLKRFLDGAWDLVKADFMEFRVAYPREGVVRWDVDRCFAHDGISKMGAIDGYECGIFERIEAWFDALGVGYRVTPVVVGCAMHTDGRCFREYTLSF